MPRIALVAAIERELLPLVRDWTTETGDCEGRTYKFFLRGDAVAVCGGIGADAARRATQAVVELYRPEKVVSVGFAGALVPELRVGDIVMPLRIVDSGDSSSMACDGGQGTLVSAMCVTGAEGKRKLAAAYNGCAVDMEAAAVAKGAAARGLKFSAVKAVSDELGFDVPGVETSVASDGRFQTWRFLLYVAPRPWLWPRVWHLGRNSRRASDALARALGPILDLSGAPAVHEVN